MAELQKINVIVDSGGRIVAAEIPGHRDEEGSGEGPSVALAPLDGQRALTIEAPVELAELSGSDLHRFFSEVRVVWPAKVEMPKFKVVRENKKKGQ